MIPETDEFLLSVAQERFPTMFAHELPKNELDSLMHLAEKWVGAVRRALHETDAAAG